MFERASKKLGLEQAVLGTRQFNDTDVSDLMPNCSAIVYQMCAFVAFLYVQGMH
jgi:hypothetical protein